MKDQLIIIGAGMAGLLAANLLRHRNPIILEAQKSLPNNHTAVLRFRSPDIGELLHIPFKRVKMLKTSQEWINPVADALAYSRKTTGTSRSDRSISSISNDTHDRWIAPSDFVERMSKGLDIRYGFNNAFCQEGVGKVLSTVPMPVLLQHLDYDREILFESVVGYNIRANLRDVDAYVSLYVPDPVLPFNRVSITGSELIVEFSLPGKGEGTAKALISDHASIVHNTCVAMDLLGLSHIVPQNIEAKIQRYAKILPIDEEERRRAIYWASTITGRAWQLGRYATWRPGLMLDDLIKDIRKIDNWIRQGEAAPYEMQRHESDWRAI